MLLFFSANDGGTYCVLCITSVDFICSVSLSLVDTSKEVRDTGEWCKSTIVRVKIFYLLRVVYVSKSINCLSSGFSLLM